MGSLIRTTHLWGYKTLVEQLGGDAEAFMARFHLTPALAHDPNAFMPYRNMAQLLEASAAELDCPDFGLRLSHWQGLDALGPIAVIARNTDTVWDAFKTIGRYLYVHAPAVHLTVGPSQPGGDMRLDLDIVEPRLPQKIQAYELSMANCMQILRILAGPSAQMKSVHFRHARHGAAVSYRNFFNCPVKFKQPRCGYYISADLAQRRIDTADTQTHRLAAKFLESQHAPGSLPLTTRVAELIRCLLSTGHCSIATVAQQLALHPRTLQRRLRALETSFDAVLEQERRDQAMHYLGESGLHLSQISGLLGYSEQSSFNRAFRRWCGTTPRHFRLQFDARSARQQPPRIR